MSSNFAFIPNTLTDTTEIKTTVDLPVFKELAFDFETGQLKTKGGQYYYVEKNEAIKTTIIRISCAFCRDSFSPKGSSVTIAAPSSPQ